MPTNSKYFKVGIQLFLGIKEKSLQTDFFVSANWLKIVLTARLIATIDILSEF